MNLPISEMRQVVDEILCSVRSPGHQMRVSAFTQARYHTSLPLVALIIFFLNDIEATLADDIPL